MVYKSHCQSLKTFRSYVPSWIPKMFPVLLQVAQRPARNPRDFFGNQHPKMAMKHGQSRAFSVPMTAMITMK